MYTLLGIGLPAEIVAQSDPTTVTRGTVAAATVGESTVGLQFKVVDGDSRQPLSWVSVAFVDQDGRQFGRGTSDNTGQFILHVPDGVTGLTALPSEPKGYMGFPLLVAPTAKTTVEIPLYRSASQWTTWGRTADRRRVGPRIGMPARRALWSYDAMNNVEFPPCLAFGLVLYGSYHGFINANDQATGRIVWQAYPGTAEKPSKFANQMVVSTWKENGRRVARVFYADLTGIVGARDVFTGTRIWETTSARTPDTGQKVRFRSFESSPLIVGETLYVASRYSSDGVRVGLWAFNRRTGNVRWYRSLGSSIGSKIGSSPTYADGRIFQATYDGTVFAIDAESGEVLWRTWLGGQFYSTPAVSGSRLYIGNKSNGRLYCLNAKNGRQHWCRYLPGTIHSSPAVHGGRVYVGAGRHFVGVSARTGDILWKVGTERRVMGSATVLKDVVYFSDMGSTYACKAGNGKVVWRFADGRYSPVTATPNLMIVCGRRVIYAYRPTQ